MNPENITYIIREGFSVSNEKSVEKVPTNVYLSYNFQWIQTSLKAEEESENSGHKELGHQKCVLNTY